MMMKRVVQAIFTLSLVSAFHVESQAASRAASGIWNIVEKDGNVVGSLKGSAFLVPRGGALQSSTVLTVHGISGLFFGAIFLLESFGIEIPVVGLAASIKGWDATNPALKLFARLATSLLVCVGLSEVKFAEEETMQSIFVFYHVPLAGFLVLSSIDAAKGLNGWIPAATASAFLVAGLIAE